MLGDRSAVCLSADATPTPRLVPIRYSCLLLVGKRRTSPLRSWHGEVSKNVQRAHRVTRLICHSDTTCMKGRCRHKEQWAALLNCELPRLPQNLESQRAGPSPTSPGCSVGPPTRSLSSECPTPCQGFVFSLLICFRVHSAPRSTLQNGFRLPGFSLGLMQNFNSTEPRNGQDGKGDARKGPTFNLL